MLKNGFDVVFNFICKLMEHLEIQNVSEHK